MKIVAIIFAASLGGCYYVHRSPTYGVAVRHAFSDQVIDRRAGQQAKADQPLDPEEAAIVAGSYRRSLTAKDPEAANAALHAPILVVPDPRNGAPR